MRRLTLLRHAKSSWDDAGLDDHDRPLAKRGLRDAPRMGERLWQRRARPGLILTSSANRAQATAAIVAEALDVADRVVVEPALYLASPERMLAIIAGQPDDVDELMLVGHNPGLTSLANHLVPALCLHNLPTAGVVAVDCPTDSWGTIDTDATSLAYYDYPKNPAAAVSQG